MIEPRFISRSIREPTVSATNRHVHDQVEGPVERRDVWGAGLPRVGRRDEVRPVLDDGWEITAFEEGLVKLEKERVREARVHIEANELGAPLHRERVELVRERLPPVRPPAKRLADSVEPRERTPVQGAPDVVDAPATS